MPHTDAERLRERLGGQQAELLVGLLSASPAFADPAGRVLDLLTAGPAEAARSVEVAAEVGRIFAAARPGGLDRREFWRHCLAVGAAAELSAEALGGALSPARAFAAGLLHDVGKWALDACLPKTYRRVLAAAGAGAGSIAQVERGTIGPDHTVVGRRIARQWRLPDWLVEAVWLHHQPAEAMPPGLASARLVAVVQLADAIARTEGIGFGGNSAPPGPAPGPAGAAGLTVEDVAAVAAELHQRVARYEEIEPDSSRADFGEPGRAGPPRHQDQDEPAGRASRPPGEPPPADVHEAIREFLRRAPADAGVPRLCEQIARAAGALRPCPAAGGFPTGAFAVVADTGELVLALTAPDGREKFRALPCQAPASAPAAEPAPAGPLLAGLADTEALADFIDLEAYVCLPLLAGGRWVGGVLLGRPPARLAGRGEEAMTTLAPLLAAVLAGGLARERADRLAEQLAQASVRLNEAQAALTDAQTMAVVGELAAGAAHEINNPLAVISGRGQLLARQAAGDADRAAGALIARKAAEASQIVTQLAAFAHPPRPLRRRASVAELLTTVAAEASAKVQPKTGRLTVDIHADGDCPEVFVDAGQIAEVLLELVRNAVTAAGGPVTVRIRAGRADAPFTHQPGTLIRVADDGPGMDARTLAAAFVPFFSRRPAGRGRGMGLAMARRTVEANGGRIWIDSRPKAGTTVFLILPAASAETSQ